MICTFVSSPYTHAEPSVMAERALAAADFCVHLTRQGFAPFSPIVHWHDTASLHDLGKTAADWRDYNASWIAKADCVHVLCLPGWTESVGVGYELDWAQGKPIYYVEPKTYRIRARLSVEKD